MTENKKTAPDVEAIESGTGNQISGQAIGNPPHNSTTRDSRPQGIVDLLPAGAENAMSTQTLVSLCGCSSARQLQERIATERANGALILSATSGGYFLPDEGEKGRLEMQEYIATLHARAINTLRAAQSAKAALAVLEGQQRMDGEELAET